MKKILSAVLLAATTTGSVAHAAGFSIDSQSGRAVGMGTAMTGFVDDASAVFFNPAGIVQGEGLKLQLGITPIIAKPAVTYQGGPTTSTLTRVSPPPHLYATYGVTRDLSVGFGIFTPFGANTAWPEGWPGQYESMGSELSTFYFNPQVGYRIHERVRFAAGFQLARATVRLLRNQNFLDRVVAVEMGGGAWGVGGNAGIQVDVLPRKLTAGLAYRSAVKLPFEGSVHFSNTDGTALPASLQPLLRDGPVKTSISMPHAVTLGAGYRLTDRVLIAAQIDWFDHSTVSAIDIRREDGSELSNTPKAWEDRFTYHLGAEFAATRELMLRAGIVYDPTPNITETTKADLPDSNRIRPSIGAGYKFGQFTGDLGYSFVILTDFEARGGLQPSVINGNAHVFSATVGFEM